MPNKARLKIEMWRTPGLIFKLAAKLTSFLAFLLLYITTPSKCQTPGTVTRGEGEGFYHLTSSTVTMLFLPSVDTFVVADLDRDYNGDYPGLRRLILMDATGNYLSEYIPPKLAFVKSDPLRLDLFGDPTLSQFVVPMSDKIYIFKVETDKTTNQKKINVLRSLEFGDLSCRYVVRMIGIPFTSLVLVLHDLPSNGNLAMISKVDLAESSNQARVLVRMLLDSNIYSSVWDTGIAFRNDEQFFVFGQNNDYTAAQVFKLSDLSPAITAVRVADIRDNEHTVQDVVQDSRRSDRTYFLTDGGLYVVDLSDPTSPVTVNYFSVSRSTISLREIPGSDALLIVLLSNEKPDVAALETLQNVRQDQSVLGDLPALVQIDAKGGGGPVKDVIGSEVITSLRVVNDLAKNAASNRTRRLGQDQEIHEQVRATDQDRLEIRDRIPGLESSKSSPHRILIRFANNGTAAIPSGPYLVMLTVPKSEISTPSAAGSSGSEIVLAFKPRSNLFLLQSQPILGGLACCSLKPGQTMIGVASLTRSSIDQSMMRVFSMVPLSPCLALYCHECTDNPNQCSVCFEGFALYQGTCITINSLGPGFGVDSELNKSPSQDAANSVRIWNTSAIKPCAVRQCTDCKFNYKECKVCKEGWTLANGVCSVELDARLQTLSSSSTETQLGYILEFSSDSKQQPTLTPSEYSDLAQNYLARSWLSPKFVSSQNASTGSTDGLSVRLRVNAVSSLVYTLTVSYNRIPQNADTLVIVCDQPSTSQFNYSEGSLSLRRKNLSFPLNMQLVSSADRVESYASFGGAVSALTLSSDNYAGSSILMALMAFDFSGHLLRFAQIIKIVNKIRFFNLNYGPKLMAFLDALGDMFKILGPRDQSKDVYNSRGFRGRISRKYVDLEFSKVFPDKIPVYIISWFLLVLNWIITVKKITVPKFYLHIMKFHPKIHMLVFNILHIDFIFYGCRTLLHARNLHTDSNLAFVILALVSADFFLLLEAVYSTPSWLRTLTWLRIAEDPVASAKNRRELAKRSDVEVKLPVEMEEKDDLNKSEAEHREESPLRKDSDAEDPEPKQQQQEQQDENDKPDADVDDEEATAEAAKNKLPKVDYPKTYRRIDWMRQRAVMLATPLLVEEQVFANKGCRAHMIVHLMRVSAYQFLPVCGQYASGLLILCLATVEVIKIYHLWMTAGAFPYLKTKVAFISELIQSMFLLLFLFLLFLMHFKDFGENVLEGPQLFCITLITIAVVIEWALTITMLFLSLLCPAKKIDKENKKKTTGIKIEEVFIYYKKPQTKSPKPKEELSMTKSKAEHSESTDNSHIKQLLDRPVDTVDQKLQSQRVQPKSFGQDSETRIKQSSILASWRGQNRVVGTNGVPSIIPNALGASQSSHSQKEISDRILEYYKRRKLAN